MDRPHRLDRRRFLAAGLGAAGLAALGCGFSGDVVAEPTGEKRPKPNLTPDQQALVKGQNDFAFELYGKLNGGTDNQFFSPFSLSTALGLAAAGARGETAAEMTRVLHLPPAEQAPAAFEGVVQSLTDPRFARPYELRVANMLWGQKGYAWQREFLELALKHYRAGLREVNFAETEQARATVNRWVSEQTAARIPELLGPGTVAADTRMVLTNAVYFKGVWQKRFDKKDTAGGDFRGGGKRARVETMSHLARHGFYRDDTLSLLELAYQGDDLSMVVLLPHRDDGLAALEKSLTADKLAGWLAKAAATEVNVWLPKFKMDTMYQPIPQLRALGMSRPFTPGAADFSGLSSAEQLYINVVVHKAFVEVGEEGTEAAAATALAFAPPAPVGGGGGGGPPEFRADHPFLFLIRDRYTGAILFLGRVTNSAGLTEAKSTAGSGAPVP